MTKVLSPKSHPVPFTKVAIRDTFWAPRMEKNRTVTLPLEYEQCRRTGRLDALKLTWKPGMPNEPHIFWDSDVAKWLEAAAYSLAMVPDKALERRADRVVDLLAKAQQPDGYLNTHYTVVEPGKRWSNLRDQHELYCSGHLMEAAVAYHAATGKRRLLDVVCRYVDYIDRVFGPGRGQKRGYPGHEGIELSLVKLYHATGRQAYRELARFFVDERGRQPHYFDAEARARGEQPEAFWQRTYHYCQAHEPVRDQTKIVGHAVRACYLYAGMADVAAETGDRALLRACQRLWANLTERKLYITGGIGSSKDNEGFAADYNLPNETAYAETCAAIGLVLWAHRMLHLDPDGRYGDVMERALYNGVLSGVSLSGDRFFYANPLAVRPRSGAEYPYTRSKWFGVACCPPNIARLIASIGGYVYSSGKDDVAIHLYVAGHADVDVAGQTVRIEQKTRYPWDGTVRLTVRPATPATFALRFRVPGWCRKAGVTLNGKALQPDIRKGYARIQREWKAGDKLVLTFPMPIERIVGHPNVRQNAGRVALQRGPIVYCLEQADNGAELDRLALPPDSTLSARFDARLLGGVTVITGKALAREPEHTSHELYRPAGTTFRSVQFRAIPYAAWANRKPGEMLVWMREAPVRRR